MASTDHSEPHKPSAAVLATAEHVVYAFDVLFSHLHQTTPSPPLFANLCWCVRAYAPESFAILTTHSPLFVTWYKDSRTQHQPRLRGCIGTLEARHLHHGLRDYALTRCAHCSYTTPPSPTTSALRDRRFPPVEKRELPHLQCSVSLLHSFERAAAWDDWTVGKHGLIIEFENAKGTHTATFLPHVASQEGWGRTETIAALVRKSGHDGGVDDALLASLRVTRYQSTAYTLSYAEYREAKQRDQVERQGQLITVAA